MISLPRRGVLAGGAALALAGSPVRAGPRPPLPLAHVDLNRMYGGWYIVATIPNGFERGMVAPYDVYAPRPGGGIQEDFYLRRGGFDAPVQHFRLHDWVRPGRNNAHWRVQIFWPINLPFLVLYTDPDYRYVLFGEDGRDLGWVYSRTPLIGDADYAQAMERFAAAGYDQSRFRKLIQTPDQIGQPGFWSDGVRRASPTATGGR
jgi:apolipoprotein D and lipocalin family protein